MERVNIRNAKDVLQIIKRWGKKRQEHFIVVTLDGCNNVIKANTVTMGIINKTIVHPRECFYRAIVDNANSVIFAHNHPSGSVEPSEEDKELTKRLCFAGKIMGFHVLDHIIITKNYSNYYSFRENGMIMDNYEDAIHYVAEMFKEGMQ